jgi:hypothetical protein
LVTDYTSWSATVADNPMPIIINAVPYIFLVDDTVKRDALKKALLDYFIGALTSDDTLQIQNTTANYNLWNDGGSGADRDCDAIRPVANSGYLIFGDSTQQNPFNYFPTVRELAPSSDIFSVATAFDSPILAFPQDYTIVWGDWGRYVQDGLLEIKLESLSQIQW